MLREARPEGRAPDDEQQRRQECGLREQRRHDAHRPDGAEPAKGCGVGREQADQRAGDGGGRGDERRQGAAQRGRHRLLRRGVVPELLPVPVDEEQGVVARCAEDKHDEDVGRQGGHGEAGVGQAMH